MSELLLERSAARVVAKGLCRRCGRSFSPKDGLCRRCRDEAAELATDVGEIYSYTIVGQGPQAFALALVRLANGRLIMGRVVGGDGLLRIGLPVELAAAGQDGPAAAGAILFRV
jgi:uncharacterized OB-fold protein